MPVSNTAVYLLDANMRPVQQGQIGELYAAGRNLAIGYVNKRDANRFIENPHTVDPGLLLSVLRRCSTSNQSSQMDSLGMNIIR